jgi:hypothetical protein
METMTKYQALIESEWDEEPCFLGVLYFAEHRGSYSRWATSTGLEYFGYFEVTFEVLRPDMTVWREAEEELRWNKRLREYYENEIIDQLEDGSL